MRRISTIKAKNETKNVVQTRANSPENNTPSVSPAPPMLTVFHAGLWFRNGAQIKSIDKAEREETLNVTRSATM